MALRFMDGFDHLPVADLAKKWTSVLGANSSIVAGRTGNCYAARIGTYLTKTLDAQATWTIGFAIKWAATATNDVFLCLLDGGTLHVYLTKLSDGRLRLSLGTAATIATSTNAVSSDTWYYVELKVTIGDNPNGVYELRVNGTSVGWIPSATGDTRNGGNATASVIWVGPYDTWGGWTYIDDLYVLDGQAGLNDFLGDCKVETLLPNGNGSHSDFVGQDANSVDNYLNVDDPSFDTDTTYNYDSTPGGRDTYTVADTAATTIHGIQVNALVRKDDPGARTFAITCISDDTTSDGATESPGLSYVDYMRILETNPDPPGNAWNATTLNAAEFGVTVVA